MTANPSVLFVCLGNICRSPLAEAAFRAEADRAGLAVSADSAGTAAYHIGSAPDPRSIAEAANHGINISGYQGRQLAPDDFRKFTHILALDSQNLANIYAIQPEDGSAQVGLLMDVIDGNGGVEIEDPYYGGDDGFARTWAEVHQAAQALVRKLVQNS